MHSFNVVKDLVFFNFFSYFYAESRVISQTTCTVNIKSPVFSCCKAQITEGCVGQVCRCIGKTNF